MANSWDAQIKLLYAASDGTSNSLATIKLDAPFDVVADIEVGENINGFGIADELNVSVRNLSQLKVAAPGNASRTLTPVQQPRNERLKVDIPSGWGGNAQVGDLLEVVATYRFDAGAYTDYSSAESKRFIVVKA